MVNPLVFTFCLWFSKEFFGSRSIVYDKLVTHAAQQIDYNMLDVDIIEKRYPAMNIKEAVWNQDRLKLEFTHVLGKCENVRVLQFVEIVILYREFWD